MLAQRLLIGGIICLAPLLVYCLILLGLNSRRRASIVPGTWDFAGVLLGCSGFILGGGPLIMGGISATWRWLVVRGRIADWTSFGQVDPRAALTLVLFVLALLFGMASLILRRRRYTVIYNADTDHVWSAFEWVFGRLGIVWQKRDGGYILQPPVRPNTTWRPEVRSEGESGSAESRKAERVTVSVLPSTCNVTLRWTPSDGETRGPVEAELSHLLPNMRAESNPATAWLVGVSLTLFALIVFSTVFLLISAVRWRIAIGV